MNVYYVTRSKQPIGLISGSSHSVRRYSCTFLENLECPVS